MTKTIASVIEEEEKKVPYSTHQDLYQSLFGMNNYAQTAFTSSSQNQVEAAFRAATRAITCESVKFLILV